MKTKNLTSAFAEAMSDREGNEANKGKLRLILGFLCVLLFQTTSVVAQTAVLFPLAQMTGTTNDTIITIKPVNNPVKFHSQIYWLPTAGIPLQTVNGSATTNLIPNDYDVTIKGVPGSWKISVNDTNVTLNAAEIGNLTTYLFTDNAGVVKQIIAGNNVTVSPSNGKGVVTVNSTGGSGGSATNAYQSQVSGLGLIIATNLVNFIYTFSLNSALQLWSAITPVAYSNALGLGLKADKISGTNLNISILLGTNTVVNGITFSNLGLTAANGNYKSTGLTGSGSGGAGIQFTNVANNAYQVNYSLIRHTGTKYAYSITNTSLGTLYSQTTNGLSDEASVLTQWFVVWPAGTAPVATPTITQIITTNQVPVFSVAPAKLIGPTLIDATYVNQSGVDTNGLSNISPYLTLEGVFNTLSNKSDIILSPGIYDTLHSSEVWPDNTSLIGIGDVTIAALSNSLNLSFGTNCVLKNVSVRGVVINRTVDFAGLSAPGGVFVEDHVIQNNTNLIDGLYISQPNVIVNSYDSHHFSSWDSVACFSTNVLMNFYDTKLVSAYNASNSASDNEVHGLQIGSGCTNSTFRFFGGSITASNGIGSNTACINIVMASNITVELYGTALNFSTTNSGTGAAVGIRDAGTGTIIKGFWTENGIAKGDGSGWTNLTSANLTGNIPQGLVPFALTNQWQGSLEIDGPQSNAGPVSFNGSITNFVPVYWKFATAGSGKTNIVFFDSNGKAVTNDLATFVASIVASGGSQTPWGSDIDAAKFNLNNLGSAMWTNSGAAIAEYLTPALQTAYGVVLSATATISGAAAGGSFKGSNFVANGVFVSSGIGSGVLVTNAGQTTAINSNSISTPAITVTNLGDNAASNFVFAAKDGTEFYVQKTADFVYNAITRVLGIAHATNSDVATFVSTPVLTNQVYETNVLVDTETLAPTGNATNYSMRILPGPAPGLATIFGAATNLNLTLTGTNNADWGRTLFVNNYTSAVNCNLSFTFTGATNQTYTAIVSNGWSAYYTFHTPDTTGTNVSIFNSAMLHH